jgi:hypothetical protein
MARLLRPRPLRPSVRLRKRRLPVEVRGKSTFFLRKKVAEKADFFVRSTKNRHSLCFFLF